MGCCESCLQKKEDGSASERDPLLDGERRRTVVTTDPMKTQNTQQEETLDGSISRSNQDEQTLLNGILMKYSSDIIDVTAIDSRIDAVEYMNRVTLYNRKLAGLGSRLEVPKHSLRSACSNPSTLLSCPLPSHNDLLLISEVSDGIRDASKDIQVVKKQDLTIDLSQR